MSHDCDDILNFWFSEVGAERWFSDDPALDGKLRANFLETYEAAVRGELRKWEDTPEGMLALVLLVGYFPYLMFRGDPKAYATEDLALDLARAAIIRHFDDRIDKGFKLFFYLPFSHSERIGDQRLAIFYIRERTKEPDWVDAAEHRLNVVQKFGRFPERNAVLGRESTPEEKAYLAKA